MPAASEVSAAPPDPGFAEPETVVAPPSVLHEEAPDVPLGALETIHGHIKFAVRVRVDSSGNVVHATLANHSPSRYFTRLAIETARKWKFAAADNQGSRQWLLRFEFSRDGATTHAMNPAQSNRTSSSLPISLRPLPVTRTARVAF
jgi:TonB family protein